MFPHIVTLTTVCAMVLAAGRARADEIWVAPSSQQDLGGLEIASNTLWPVTPAGAVRLAWPFPTICRRFKAPGSC